MARAKVHDYLHNFRFHVMVVKPDGTNFDLGTTSGGADPSVVSAGFNTCSVPEVTQSAVEYREGHYIYSRKMSGLPAVSDISLSRGVALKDGTFWKWMKDVVEDNSEYRASLRIMHYHRDAKPATSPIPGQPEVAMRAGQVGAIEYLCSEAFPIKHKVGSDLDATGAEVSIQSIDFAIEHFDIIDHSVTP